MFYLLDWERTLQSGIIHYWKGNKHGYTFIRASAGLFSEEEASRIVERDRDNKTVMLAKVFVDDIVKECS